MGWDEAGMVRKVSEIGGKFGQAYEAAKYSNIVDTIKAKTGGVSDIDAQLTNLQYQRNKVRPMALAKYASVIDPVQREALIAQEEQRIDSDISRLTGIREKRAGTINEMIAAEVKDKENMLSALGKQYEVAKYQLGDMREAEKTKKQMEKLAIEIQQAQVDLDKSKADMPYDIEKARLDVAGKYKDLYGAPPEGANMSLGNGINPKTGQPYVTVRNNNPTNMSWDVLVSLVGEAQAAKMASVGEKFTNGANINYAKFGGDPVKSTIEALDFAANSPNKSAFRTQKGQPRWTYIDMSDEQWLAMTPEQKTDVIKRMNKEEGGWSGFFDKSSGGAAGDEVERYLTNSSFTEAEKKSIRADAAKYKLTVDKVKELYPAKKSEGKEDDVESTVRSIVDQE